MSLTRIALRIAAVRALRGQTSVGENVLDSEIGALDVQSDGTLRGEAERPFIAVYTDSGEAEDRDTALRALNGNGVTDIFFEAGVTAAMATTDPETGESVLVEGLPATDRTFELHLDMVMRQICDALTDPENEWAEIFRKLTMAIVGTKRGRIASEKGGIRRAAHQLMVRARLVADPVRGIELKSGAPMRLFLDRLGASGSQEDLAVVAMIEAQIAGEADAVHAARRRYGWTVSEARHLQIAPVDGVDPDTVMFSIETGTEPSA